MKARRILPLVLLAVGALFLLSSCDQMLDAIFSSNQITVNVRVSESYFYPDFTASVVTAYGAPQITVTLNSAGTITQAGPYTSYTVDGLGYAYYSFTLPKLASGDYSITTAYAGHNWVGSKSSFTDPSGNPTSSITMPYKNGGSSSSVVVSVTLP